MVEGDDGDRVDEAERGGKACSKGTMDRQFSGCLFCTVDSKFDEI